MEEAATHEEQEMLAKAAAPEVFGKTKVTKLVMHGFKSFAKRTELVFGPDFNCILGPNGSGKSNVLDALCFVLGKSSAKSLRAEKSANLIYNGGKKKKAGKEAEVSIYFDNTSGVFPTDAKEVKVTRIVKQSGQGKYLINDEVRTRTQILDLLSLAKINPDGYNIILQGDIVKLVDMSPNERREIIEEIAGISVYEEKKQKAVNELEKVDARIKEAEIILQERDGYLKELKKEYNQAQKYKDLQDKVNTNKATTLHRKIQKGNAEKQEFDERAAKHQKKLDETNSKIKELKEYIATQKKEVEAINAEIEQKGEKEQVDLHKEVEALKVDVATGKSRIESCKDEISKIIQRKDNLDENLKDVNERIKNLESEQTSYERQLKTKKEEQSDVDHKLEAFKKKHNIDDVGKIEQEIDQLDKKAETQEKKMQDLRGKQQELLREKDVLEYKIQTIDDRIAKLKGIAAAHKKELEELKSKKAEFKKTTLELNKLFDEESKIAAELGTARKRIIDANEELHKLRARSMAIQESRGQDAAVKSILNSGIKGVHGTVADLGEVSKKYSLALEIAAGQKLKSIVVENDKIAHDCISHIKKNKLGIATFLPMNKIRAKPIDPNARSLAHKSGVHGLAVDLVTFDAQFKNIFSYVFGSSIVVDDLSTARKIGVGTCKMVTIEGDVCETSGAMQGGFRNKRPALGFAEREVSKAIKEFEKKSAESAAVVSKLEKTKTDVEERIIRLREFKANLEGDIITMEKTLHLDSDDADVDKKTKEDLKTRIADVEKQLDKVMDTIADETRSLTDVKVKRQELKSQISELKSPTLVAQLNSFMDKKTELRESIIKIESELKNLLAQTDIIVKNEKESITRVLKQHDTEKTQFEQEIKKITEKNSTLEKDLKEKEKKEKEFYEQFKGLFTKRQKLTDDINDKETKGISFNDTVREVEHKLNLVNLEKAKIEALLSELEKEFEEYRNTPIDHDKPDSQIQREIVQFEKMVENMGAVNLKALEIYDTAKKEFEDLNQRKDNLESEKQDVLELMGEIEKKKITLFMRTFEQIQAHFKRIFLTLLSKGDAFLELENQESPFEGGMNIKVKLSGSKFMDIRSLSGGEKTMTALAFLFAVQEDDPASFYVLDEVDAALDKKNSNRLAGLVRSYCDRAQYIIISHNDGVISSADNLYGVSMDEHGVTDVVSLKI